MVSGGNSPDPLDCALPELSAGRCRGHLYDCCPSLGVTGPDKPDEAGHHTTFMAVVSSEFCLPSPARPDAGQIMAASAGLVALYSAVIRGDKSV